MPEIQKLIQLCRKMMQQLAYYKKTNKDLEQIISDLRQENKELQSQLLTVRGGL